MREIIINTGPIIALTAAVGSLSWMGQLYDRVIVPGEVFDELLAGGPLANECGLVLSAGGAFAVREKMGSIRKSLLGELDLGEASVLETALTGAVSTVAIDEVAGRRIARIYGLKVTGSLGILVRAKKEGIIKDLRICIQSMKAHGVWISDELTHQILASAGEQQLGGGEMRADS